MPKKKKKKVSDDLWALARTKYHLSSRQIEMAKKLGMNPKKKIEKQQKKNGKHNEETP